MSSAKDQVREFLKTPKGKLAAAGGALLLSWIYLFSQMSGDLSSWVPDPKREKEMKLQIRKLSEENHTLQMKLRKNVLLKKQYLEKTHTEWKLKKDGDPETKLPEMIESAAKKAELKLNNFGSVKQGRINTDFFYAELDVSANASIETIMKFVHEIRNLKPAVSWRRFNANVIMRRQQQTNKVSSVNQAKAQMQKTTDLIFSGTLRVVVYEGDNASSQQGGKK